MFVWALACHLTEKLKFELRIITYDYLNHSFALVSWNEGPSCALNLNLLNKVVFFLLRKVEYLHNSVSGEMLNSDNGELLKIAIFVFTYGLDYFDPLCWVIQVWGKFVGCVLFSSFHIWQTILAFDREALTIVVALAVFKGHWHLDNDRFFVTVLQNNV